MAPIDTPRFGAALTLLILAAASAACITETVSSTGTTRAMQTEGIIVFAPLDESWTVVQDVVNSMASEPPVSAGLPNSLKAMISGASTTVLVDFKEKNQTAVHVRSDSPRVAERIRSAVQFRLSQR